VVHALRPDQGLPLKPGAGKVRGRLLQWHLTGLMKLCRAQVMLSWYADACHLQVTCVQQALVLVMLRAMCSTLRAA
jgi:hypothetical protein